MRQISARISHVRALLDISRNELEAMIDKPSSKLDIIVTVDDEHIHRLIQIAERIADCGVEDIRTLASLGAITGTCGTSTLKKLQKIKGVKAVEVSEEVRIEPPGSITQ